VYGYVCRYICGYILYVYMSINRNWRGTKTERNETIAKEGSRQAASSSSTPGLETELARGPLRRARESREIPSPPPIPLSSVRRSSQRSFPVRAAPFVVTLFSPNHHRCRYRTACPASSILATPVFTLPVTSAFSSPPCRSVHPPRAGPGTSGLDESRAVVVEPGI